ncbi:IucA/IucC family protein [Tenacibaculum sp. nBUS_03]|uniref:IucA/IucC family protein n=1 Tax=Tenacibaculum sp. nBUS_03 TaxID=3395320 RepID=UPI003EBD4D06
MDSTISYIEPHTWKITNKLLVRKAISEFSHELIFTPKKLTNKEVWNTYSITSDTNTFMYSFEARKFELDHWYIDLGSIKKFKNEQEVSIDAIEFITEFQNTLQIPNEFLATYLEEISSTLISSSYKYNNQKFSSEELAFKNFQEIEHAMTEGHPCFVANNGRIGFNINDYEKYAPETDNPFKIYWIAGHKKYTTYTATEGFEYEKLLTSELGEIKCLLFKERLEYQNLDIANYVFMPVHPWQWNNKLVHVFAGDIATKNIVFLGESDDEFSAQQSIRTLFNKTHPKKLYTKTALSILNMGFVRGLSPYYMKSTPHITKWINNLLKDDTYLKENGFTMLGEVATVGYHNHYYETLGKTNPHNKMLSALWRESPYTKITTNQEVITMAALLHVDYENTSLLVEFIKASKLNVNTWIEKYLKSYLSPLLHCFYKYEMVFMPHGENLILVLENQVPVYALMKDITEEVIVFNEEMYLPEHADRLFTKSSDKMKVLSIFTDVFDCIFRFMAQLLETHGDFPEENFWRLVAQCIYNYQNEHPEFTKKFEKYNLFTPEFDRCCLNRLQLSNTKQMLNLSDPIESLKLEGVLKNPIAKYVNKEIKEKVLM